MRAAKSQLGSQRAIAGFTLIEAVMVVLISMVVAAFAIPIVKDVVNNYRLQSAVANATWSIQSTRFQSLMEGYQYNVTLQGDGSGNNPTYQVASEAPPATSFSNVGSSVPLSGSTVNLNAKTVLLFKPNGTVTATTGGLSFQITYGNYSRTITVSNYGNVKVATP